MKITPGTTEKETNTPEKEQKEKDGEKHGGNDEKEEVGDHQEEERMAEGETANGVKGYNMLRWSERESMAEVCAVGDDHQRGDIGEREIWGVREDSEWFRELTRFLLRGDFAGRNMGTYEKRRIRLWSRRFVFFDGRLRKGLFHRQKDGRLSLCVLAEAVIPTCVRGALQWVFERKMAVEQPVKAKINVKVRIKI